MVTHYERYIREVVEYFKDRTDDLLVINVGEEGAYQKLAQFLGVDLPLGDSPWGNHT
jgi:hypothetical protein